MNYFADDVGQELRDKGKSAPRITPQMIEEAVVGEYYFTASQAVEQIGPPLPKESPLRQLTFCVLVLRNGFTVTGESACASPENFDAEIGKKIARKAATDKIWALEGYLLKEKLSKGLA